MTRILFVGSNPRPAARPHYGASHVHAVREAGVLQVRDISHGQLDLAGELADVRSELSRGGRGQIQLFALEQATVDEVIHAIAQVSADIVHFSGHGTRNGLVFVTDDGSRELSGADFALLLEALGRRQVRLVVLNACYSETQAGELLRVADFVLCTEKTVDDARARQFSRNFYYCLATGKSLAQALAVAGVASERSGVPKLHARSGVDATRCYFTRQRSDEWVDPRRGDYHVIVLERADADERRLHELLASATANGVHEIRDQLRAGAVVLHGLSEAVSLERLTELQTAGALVTRVLGRAGDDVDIVRGVQGLWFGAVVLPDGRRSWLSLHPVTRSQFEELDGRRVSPNQRWLPQTRVSYYEAARFAARLSGSEQAFGRYRLPTREEWLAACADVHAFAERHPEALWRIGRVSSDCTTRVGSYPPSERGFLDLVGNVAEWTGSADGNGYVVCGGSFRSAVVDFPSAWAVSAPPLTQADWLGFRVACDAESR